MQRKSNTLRGLRSFERRTAKERRPLQRGRNFNLAGCAEVPEMGVPFGRDMIVLLHLLNVIPMDDIASGQGADIGGDLRRTAEVIDKLLNLPYLRHNGNVGKIFRQVKCDRSADCSGDRLNRPWQSYCMVKDPYKEACGTRLRKTRIALGYQSIRKFARLMSESEDNIGKWERGIAQVPPPFVSKLKELFGVSHDWIFAGDASGIRHELAIELLKPDEEEEGI